MKSNALVSALLKMQVTDVVVTVLNRTKALTARGEAGVQDVLRMIAAADAGRNLREKPYLKQLPLHPLSLLSGYK